VEPSGGFFNWTLYLAVLCSPHLRPGLPPIPRLTERCCRYRVSGPSGIRTLAAGYFSRAASPDPCSRISTKRAASTRLPSHWKSRDGVPLDASLGRLVVSGSGASGVRRDRPSQAQAGHEGDEPDDANERRTSVGAVAPRPARRPIRRPESPRGRVRRSAACRRRARSRRP
jgi:hypothetical protein